MSQYLSYLAHTNATRGTHTEYLFRVLAVAMLPAAAAFFLLLALLSIFWALAAGAAFLAGTAREGLAGLLYRGRIVLAERLRLIADVIDPRPLTAPLDSRPSWEPDTTCPDCGAQPFDCSCVWSTVPCPEPVQAATAPEPEPVVFLPLTGTVDEPEPLPEPEPMPSAAQVTQPAAAAEPDGADAIRAALAEHGSIRAAARALGMAESSLRSKAKRLGISTGKAKGKRAPNREEAA
jgi:hypothetical protein